MDHRAVEYLSTIDSKMAVLHHSMHALVILELLDPSIWYEGI